MAFRRILSGFGKLGLVALLAVAFAFGLLTTVYLSLRSPNVQVPDVTNKTYIDGEKLLGKSGLDISQRATRYKPDVPPGVILDQTPRPGEVIKGGQVVRVVVSRAPKEGEQPPDETVAAERREERGTEALTQNQNQNQNQNSNRRKPANRNSNGNLNSNSAANANGNENRGETNANSRSTGVGNTNLAVNRNANRNSNGGANANHNRNANTGTHVTITPARPAVTNANRRPIP